jgi:lysophospholipase L1-like esterase
MNLLGIPYLFTYFCDYEKKLAEILNLYNMLDQSCIYNKQNIYTITKDNNWYAKDKVHPGIEAHKKWAEIITPLINNARQS